MRYFWLLAIIFSFGCDGGGTDVPMAGAGGNGAGGAGGEEPPMMIPGPPPGSTLPPGVAECERGCITALSCYVVEECTSEVRGTLATRCRDACVVEANRAQYTDLDLAGCPNGAIAALSSLGVSGECAGGPADCETPEGFCEDDAGCGVGEACDFSGRCVCARGNQCNQGACSPFNCQADVNDGAVRNDQWDSATMLSNMDQTNQFLTLCGAYEDLNANGELDPGEDLNANDTLDNDSDWYSFTVPAGVNVLVDVIFSHAVGDVDVKLFDASMFPGEPCVTSDECGFGSDCVAGGCLPDAIESATSTNDNEYITIVPAEMERSFYLRMYTFGSASNAYDLHLNFDVPVTLCGEADPCADGQECDDSMCYTPAPCTVTQGPDGMPEDSCGFSEVCEVATGICRDCLGDLDCGETGACIDMECFDCRDDTGCLEGDVCIENDCKDCRDDSQCTDGARCNEQNVCVECVADADCPDGGTCAENRCQSADCADAYEPNDSVEEATPLTPGSPLLGVVACGDEDWFRFNVPAGTPFLVNVTHLHAEGDIDITLYQSEMSMGSSVSVTDNESIGVPGSHQGGDFELKVRRLGQEGVQTYDLDVQLNPPFELCGSDDDCAEGVCISGQCGECGIDAHCPDDRPCDRERNICEQIGWCGQSSHCPDGRSCNVETHTCNEEGFCSSHRQCNGTADMPSAKPECDLNTNICIPCSDDAFEPNDDALSAIDAGGVAGQSLNTCGGRDFYSLAAQVGQTITVQLDFVHMLGDIDVKLWAPGVIPGEMGASSAATSAGIMDGETIEHVAEAAGNYVIEVYGFQDVYNTYTINASAQ